MSTYRLLMELNQDWHRQCLKRHDVVENWAGSHPCLGAAAGLNDLLELIRQDPDPTLRALLDLGAHGDRMAYRVVVQALLGKLVLLSRGEEEWFDEAVSVLWVTLADYPLERRPRAIVSNVLWALRRQLAQPPTVLMPQAGPDASAEATLHCAREYGFIDDETVRLLWLVYVLGLNSGRAGAVLGISPENVRYRCSRTLRQLAQQAPLLAA
ncbi:MAG: hypothetical protein K4304_05225 [Propionicimonas sp.]